MNKHNWTDFLDRHYKIFFCIPFIFLYGVVLIIPLIRVVQMSFLQWDLVLNIRRFVGLGNYIQILFEDEYFRHSLRVTGLFSAGALIIKMIAGILLAQLLQVKFKGKNIIGFLLFLPWFASPAVMGVIWRSMYHPMLGVFNYMLETVNLPTSQWIFSTSTVLPSLILFSAWQGIPFCLILFLGGFAMLPSAPFEAAKIEGAGSFQIFWYITLPLLRSVIFVVFVLDAVNTIKIFDAVYSMTQGGPARASEVLYFLTYKTVFSWGRIGYGAAIGMMLFFIILILAILLAHTEKITRI